jgi:hypothetical protein
VHFGRARTEYHPGKDESRALLCQGKGAHWRQTDRLNIRYQLIAPEIKEMYEKSNRSTEKIRKIFGIKSQLTLYRILQFSEVKYRKFKKKKRRIMAGTIFYKFYK